MPLRTVKIDKPEFHALFTPELNQLSKLFKNEGYELRIAGGPVRDLLMNIQPDDVDFATTATPPQMISLFERQGIRMLHKRGEEHGTITCRLNDCANFEITTLRIDVVCDGRRARVEFTDNWEEDAYRRDLTINSLFLGLDGTVYDFTGGIEDIEKRRIAFVGEASQRIQEDYLRILRYFRFFGRIADDKDIQHDKAAIEAITKYREGLNSVSGERIWAELRKIVIGRMAPHVLKMMLRECHLSEVLALDEKFALSQLDVFERVTNSVNALKTNDEKPLPCTVLSAFFPDMDAIDKFHKRVKFANHDKILLEFIVENREEAERNVENLFFFKKLLLDVIQEAGAVATGPASRCTIELLKYLDAKQTLADFRLWLEKLDVFPVTGLQLMQSGVPKGPGVRNVLRHLYNLWTESEYKMSSNELIKHATDELPVEAKKLNVRKRRWAQIS